jgi:beta-glucosidase
VLRVPLKTSAGIALGASSNPALARGSGAMLGCEARSRGFNVQLAGGINLHRDPRNGRNFEYLSEDPLLSATLAAESINGIQGEGVISTIKHYSLNCNETNRHCWMRSSTRPRTASQTCWRLRSRSSDRIPAR